MSRSVAKLMVVGLTSLTVLVGAVRANDEIEALMKTIAGKKGGAHPALKKLLVGAEPDWSAVSTETKKYADSTAKLAAMKPEKGDQKSWEKLCKEFDAAAKELNAAAGKKDKKAADAAFAKLSEACEVCHEAHR